jgi:hypothetical protein
MTLRGSGMPASSTSAKHSGYNWKMSVREPSALASRSVVPLAFRVPLPGIYYSVTVAK